MSLVFWQYFWEIELAFLLFIFILFTFFVELRSSAVSSLCLMVFFSSLLFLNILDFNFLNSIDFTLLTNNNIYFFLFNFIFLFISIYFWQIFFSRQNSKMEFGTLFFFIFFLGLCIFKIHDFLEAFLIIESLSFIAYILAGFEKDTKTAASVGIQYLIIGSISSIFLVLSLLLVYYQFSTTSLLNLSILDLSNIASVLNKPSLLIEWNYAHFNTFNNIDNSKDVLKASSTYLSEYLFNIHNSHSIFQEYYWKPLNMDFNPSASVFVENYKEAKSWLGYSYLNDFNYTHINLFQYLADFEGTSTWLFSEKSPYFDTPLNHWYFTQSFDSGNMTKGNIDIFSGTTTLFFSFTWAVQEQKKKTTIEDWPDVEPSDSSWVNNFSENLIPMSIDDGSQQVFFIPKNNNSQSSFLSKIETKWDLDIQTYTLNFKKYFEYIEGTNSSFFGSKDFLQSKFNNLVNWPTLSLDHVDQASSIYNLLKLPGHSVPYFGRSLESVFYELTYYEDTFDFFFCPLFLDDLIENQKNAMDNYLLNWANFFTQNYEFTFVDSFIFGVLIVSLSFLMGTLLYKIKGAPFHIWAPTIYTRMPTGSMVILVTTFTLIFSLYFFQLFFSIFSMYEIFFSQVFLISGLLSLIFGFFGAFDQKILKKFFIFSSIGHVAFLLFTFISQSSFKNGTLLLVYLLIYILSTILLWYLITFNNTKIDFLTNLLKKIKANTFFYFIFIIIIFSMSGIPPLAGFYIKFDVLSILINCNEFFILFLSLLITVASFYYYLRLIKIATFENFAPSLFNPLSVEKFWLFVRLSFLFTFIPLLLCFPLVFEQSFFYFFSYSNLY